MTVMQWRELADYLGNVEFDDRDELHLTADPGGTVRARVIDDRGLTVGEVDVPREGE
jgi:hypothetical protein